jgi:HSP20 family protein
MAIIPWKPFGDIERFFNDDWFDIFERADFNLSNFKSPKVDIYEENNNLVAEIELPGVDAKDIKAEIKNNYLNIEAKKETKKEEKEKGYYRKEISTGYYKRVIPLPVEVVSEKAEAEYKDGILKVVVPKKTEKKEEKGIKIKLK